MQYNKYNTYNNGKSAFHTLDYGNVHMHAGGIVDFASSIETHKKMVNISMIKIYKAKSP